MVFFTCNHCGESAKKPAVEKHYNQKCRGKHVSVSCMDCLKDFYGNEYVAHTKCISEAEKYSGRGFTEKESKNKGAKKQESWMEIIRSILHTPNYNLSPRARTAFQKLQSVDNVPRKKAKFQNFIASSLHMSQAHSEEIWKVLEKELEKMKMSKQVVANADLEVNDENGEKSTEEKPKKAAKRNPYEVDGVDSPVSKKNKIDETSVETHLIETNNENSSQTEKKSKDKKSKKEAKDTVKVTETNGETKSTTNEKKSKDKKSKKQAKDEVEAVQSNSNVKSEQELDSDDNGKLERNGELNSEEKGAKSRDDDTQVSKTNNEDNSSQIEKKSKSKKSKKGTKGTVEVPEINSETKSTTNEKKSKDKKLKKKAKDELEAVQSNSNATSTTNVKLEQELDADTNTKVKINDEAERPAENGKKSKKKDSKNAATGNPAQKNEVHDTSDQTQVTEPNNEKKSFRDGEKQIKDNVGNVEANSEEKSKTNAKKSKDKKSKKHLKDNMDMGEAKLSNDEKKSKNEESKKDGNLNSGEDGLSSSAEKYITQKSITTDETSLAEDEGKCLESKKTFKRNLAESTDADMPEPKKTKSSENVTAGKENCAQKNICWTAEMREIVNKHAEGISLEKLEKKLLKKYTTLLDSEYIDGKQQKMFEKKFKKYLKKCTELHGFQLNDNIVKVC